MPKKAEPAFLSTRQFAETIGVHPRTVTRWIQEGRIRATRFGRVVRIPVDQLDALARDMADRREGGER